MQNEDSSFMRLNFYTEKSNGSMHQRSKKKQKFYKNFNTVIDKIQLSKFANSIYRMYFCAV